MEKKFCQDCKHYDSGRFDEYCDHPKNFEDSPIKPRATRRKHPREINVDNDCGWFSRRIGLFERLGKWFRRE